MKSVKPSFKPLLSILFSAFIVLSLSAHEALAAAKISPLSETDRETVARVEAYLNDLVTMKSRFLQASSTGNYAEGTFYLNRPGKMRIEYDPPVKFLIVADGTWLMYLDKELDQLTHLPLGSTPADILVQENISLLFGDITVSKVEHAPGVVSVTLMREDEEGGLTLIFADKPLELKKWIVIDPQGVKTSVSLLSTQRDLSFDPGLFRLKLRPAKTPDVQK